MPAINPVRFAVDALLVEETDHPENVWLMLVVVQPTKVGLVPQQNDAAEIAELLGEIVPFKVAVVFATVVAADVATTGA